MCCKCCQSCLESIYWHCIEKHFCYDESIALYEEEGRKEETKEEKNNNSYDNLAFYDNVAIIANRAIFCIEPLPDKSTTVITQQPQKKLKWWEVDVDGKPPERTKSDTDVSFIIPTIHEELSSTIGSNASFNSSGSLATIREENISTSTRADDTRRWENSLNLPPSIKLRKKSLHERRVSKSLTLHIEKAEVPIIRQSSFPKFYLDTPNENRTDSSILRTPILALETPILPNSHFKFDLRSVVQIENEKLQNITPAPKEHRLSHIKDKLRPLKILRNSSTNSLYGNS